MQEISGQTINKQIIERLQQRPKPKKILAAILIGSNPQSESFLKQKKNVAEKLGVDFRIYHLDETHTKDALRKEIGKLARQNTVGGVIIQLPIPGHLNAQYILNAVPPEKDLDVLGERALGAFYAERNPIMPPSVETAKELLEATNHTLEASTVAVLGLGSLIGKPISSWLSGKCKELMLFHKGSDIKQLKNADIIILGTGQPHLLSVNDVAENALIIDFGYAQKDGKLVGDFNPQQKTMSHKPLAIRYTVTPGGTGPILVAKLFENFYKATSK